MQKKGVVFSDVDGTLCFHQDTHGIREIKINPDGTVLVEDPQTYQHYLAYNVSVGSYKAYLAKETQELGQRVQEAYAFIYVTSARPSIIYARKDVLNFADGVILEKGRDDLR